jgi:hypothetical protein
MANIAPYVSSTQVAESVPYDNTDTGAEAENVQEALLVQTTLNLILKNFSVKNEYTRMHPNLKVNDGVTVTVEDGGELIVL